MNGWAERIASLAASTLPAHVRSRYREEWMSDIDGARESGMSAAGIAGGAVLFSATLNRDAPHISGMSVTDAARRHARWGIALLGAASANAFGGAVLAYRPSAADGFIEMILAGAAHLWPLATVLLAVAGVAFLWRAANLTSGLAKISAAAATTAVLIGFVTVRSASVFDPIALLALLTFVIGGVACGALAWSSAPPKGAAPKAPQPAGSAQPEFAMPIGSTPGTPASTVQEPDTALGAREAPARRPLGRGRLVVLGVVGIPVVLALALSFASSIVGLLAMLGLVSAAASGVTLLVLKARKYRREAGRRSRETSRAFASIVLLGVTALGALAIGGIDLLVWTPMWMVPDYALPDIYGALSSFDRASGLTMIAIWFGFWLAAVLVYLIAGLFIVRRPHHPSARMFVLAGLGLVAGIMFFQGWAGFSIGMSIADTLATSGGRSDLGVLYNAAGQLPLVAVIIGAIAPARLVGPAYSVAHA